MTRGEEEEVTRGEEEEVTRKSLLELELHQCSHFIGMNVQAKQSCQSSPHIAQHTMRNHHDCCVLVATVM